MSIRNQYAVGVQAGRVVILGVPSLGKSLSPEEARNLAAHLIVMAAAAEGVGSDVETGEVAELVAQIEGA